MRGTSVFLAVFLSLLATHDIRADEAGNVQLNPEHTGASRTGAMSPVLTSAWTVDLGSTVSRAAIAEGKVFVEAAGHSDGHGNTPAELYALDAGTGEVIWGPVLLPGYFGSDSAPAYENGRVFTAAGTGLQAFDAATGLPLWTRTVDTYGSAAKAPTVRAGVVYAGISNTIAAVDAVYGSLVWSTYIYNGYDASPTVSDDGVYVGYQGGYLYKFNPANGANIWTYSGRYSGLGVGTALDQGRLYAPGAENGPVVDAATGNRVDQQTALDVPAFAQGKAYGVVGAGSTSLLAFDKSWTFGGDSALAGSPLYLNDYLYVASTKGQVFGVDAANGHQVWTADLSAALPAGSATPALRGLAAAQGLLAVPVGNTVAGFSYTVTLVPLIDPPSERLVTGRDAQILAGINPNGSATSVHVVYGTEATYGSTTVEIAIGGGTDVVNFKAQLSNLTPGTLYHYRVVSTNLRGTSSSRDQTFMTGSELKPGVTTALPLAASQTAATLQGFVNPNGLATTVSFEFGPNTSYGSPTDPVALAGLNAQMPVTANIAGLSPNTRYHYRVVASNANGTSLGSDQSFLTPPPLAPVIQNENASESEDGVVLGGQVNPGGAAVTAHFEWGYYYNPTQNRTEDVPLGAGTDLVSITAHLPAQLVGVSIAYRLVASSVAGTTTGNGNVFYVQGKAYRPTVTTGDATFVDKHTATIAGYIVSERSLTAHIEYGPTTDYGSSMPVSLYTYYPTGPNSTVLGGLAANTQYHYRLVASTDTQTVYGDDRTFTTKLYSSNILANSDSALVFHHAAVRIAVLENDVAEPGEALTITAYTQGEHGAVTQEGDVLIYTPDGKLRGPDSFEYTVQNPNGNPYTASVYIDSGEVATAGNYSGLIGQHGDAFDARGQVVVSVTAGGKLTGKVRVGARTWPLLGQLAESSYHSRVRVDGQPVLDVRLTIDPTVGQMQADLKVGGSDTLSAQFVKGNYSHDNPAAQANRYTLMLDAISDTTARGIGYATLKVSNSGTVTLAGRMGDGRLISSGAFVDDQAGLPLYACLQASRHESLAGLVYFRNNYYSNMDGTLSWLSPSAAQIATNGLSVELAASGSIWVLPAPHTRLLDFPSGKSNGILATTTSNQSVDFSTPFTLSQDNLVYPVTSASQLSFQVGSRTGFFSGLVTDPTTRRVYAFRGVFLPCFGSGYGSLLRNGTVVGTVTVSHN